MPPQSLITDELQKCIGLETEPVVIEIDQTLLGRFVDAVGDTNPLWCDQGRAAAGSHGSLIAPPSLLCTSMFMGNNPVMEILRLLPPRSLDGGGEWQFHRPIAVGDRVTVRARLADIVERPGRLGTMLLVISEITWQNQRDELVGQARTTLIRY